MKKFLFVALLGSAIMMSCGGASTKTVEFDDVDTTLVDTVEVDTLINDSIV